MDSLRECFVSFHLVHEGSSISIDLEAIDRTECDKQIFAAANRPFQVLDIYSNHPAVPVARANRANKALRTLSRNFNNAVAVDGTPKSDQDINCKCHMSRETSDRVFVSRRVVMMKSS